MSAFSCRRSPAIDMKRPTTRACQTLQSCVAFRFCAVHQSRNEDFLVRNIPLFGSLALDLMNGRHIPRFISSSRHCPRPLGSQLDSSARSLLQRLAGSWQHFEGSLTCTPHQSYARNTKLMRFLRSGCARRVDISNPYAIMISRSAPIRSPFLYEGVNRLQRVPRTTVIGFWGVSPASCASHAPQSRGAGAHRT